MEANGKKHPMPKEPTYMVVICGPDGFERVVCTGASKRTAERVERGALINMADGYYPDIREES